MVEDKLNELGIPFSIQGQDFIVKCLNPAHEDNNPSMRIDMHTGAYHCFSCSYKGMLLDSDSTRVLKLSRRISIMKDKIALIQKLGQDMPIGAVPFLNYFRNISPATFKHFSAFTDSSNQKFEDRIVFPIFDIDNNITCFQARLINSSVGAKYIFYPRGTVVNTYPVNTSGNTIVLVEGFFDMINLWDKGVKNAVCTFGTGISKRKDLLEKMSIYKLQGITNIFILFDGDKAGNEASEILKERLSEEYVTDTIYLPQGTDPGSLNRQEVFELQKLLT